MVSINFFIVPFLWVAAIAAEFIFAFELISAYDREFVQAIYRGLTEFLSKAKDSDGFTT